MDEDYDLERSEFKAKRFKELGFHPQKEIPANRLLPVFQTLFAYAIFDFCFFRVIQIFCC